MAASLSQSEKLMAGGSNPNPVPDINGPVPTNTAWGRHLMALQTQNAQPSNSGSGILSGADLDEAKSNIRSGILSGSDLDEAKGNIYTNVSPDPSKHLGLYAEYQLKNYPKSFAIGALQGGQKAIKNLPGLISNVSKATSPNVAQLDPLTNNPVANKVKSIASDLYQKATGFITNPYLPKIMNASQNPSDVDVRHFGNYVPSMIAASVAGPEGPVGIAADALGQGVYGAAMHSNAQNQKSSFLWNALLAGGMGGLVKTLGFRNALMSHLSGQTVNQAGEDIKLNNMDKNNAIEALNTRIQPQMNSEIGNESDLKDSLAQNQARQTQDLNELEMGQDPVSSTSTDMLGANIIKGLPDAYKAEEAQITGGNRTVGKTFSDTFDQAMNSQKTAQNLADRNLNRPMPEDLLDSGLDPNIANDISMYDMAEGVNANKAIKSLPQEMQSHIQSVFNPEGQGLTEPGIRESTTGKIVPVSKFSSDPAVQQQILRQNADVAVHPEIPSNVSVQDAVSSLPDKAAKATAIRSLRQSGAMTLNKNRALFKTLPQATQDLLEKNNFAGATKADFMKAETGQDFQQIVQNLNEQARGPLKTGAFGLTTDAARDIHEGIVHPILKNWDSKIGTKSSEALRMRNQIIHNVTAPFESTPAAKAVANGSMNSVKVPVSKIRDALAGTTEKTSKFKNAPGTNISAPVVPGDHYISSVLPKVDSLAEWDATPATRQLKAGTYTGDARQLHSDLQKALATGKISTGSTLEKAASRLKSHIDQQDYDAKSAKENYEAKKNSINTTADRVQSRIKSSLKDSLSRQNTIKENYNNQRAKIINESREKDVNLQKARATAKNTQKRLKANPYLHERLVLNHGKKLKYALTAARLGRAGYRANNTGS